MIMSAKALLDLKPKAGRDEIKHALAGNICRCTGYVQILNSVEAAQKFISAGTASAGGGK
jgi:aerobic-type carbon monoxide dehydrogenase small subunit (CoxS/CutS family)